ncbi:Lactonase drp35 [Fusarium oxysporum f. sp. albedinis]|nr:Lactonase drp35 [Fusarium oxysporum f. sp. albedinis]
MLEAFLLREDSLRFMMMGRSRTHIAFPSVKQVIDNGPGYIILVSTKRINPISLSCRSHPNEAAVPESRQRERHSHQ